MLEPQSTFLFVVLILIFGGLVWWLVIARRVAFRVIAGCLAGIAGVALLVAAAVAMALATRTHHETAWLSAAAYWPALSAESAAAKSAKLWPPAAKP